MTNRITVQQGIDCVLTSIPPNRAGCTVEQFTSGVVKATATFPQGDVVIIDLTPGQWQHSTSINGGKYSNVTPVDGSTPVTYNINGSFSPQMDDVFALVGVPLPKPQPPPAPVPSPQPPQPQPNENMTTVITKPINTRSTAQQPWTFPEGSARFSRGISQDGSVAFIEVDPASKPGNPCWVQVSDIGTEAPGGVLGVFKQGLKWKVVRSNCFGG